MTDAAKYPIPAQLNLLIVVLQLIALAGIFYATSLSDAWWQLLLLWGAMAIVGNSVYSVIHESEHRILHPNPRVNDAIGIAMALFFPAPFHLIRQGHLGHHMRNRSDDEAFDLYFEDEYPVLKWLQLYGIITGVYWMSVVLANVVVLLAPFLLQRKLWEYDRPSAALMESLNPRYWTIIRLEALAAIVLHGLIIWSLQIPILNYLVVYFGFGFSWSAMQYVHHFATERDVLRGARNLWVFAPIDFIWLHHNWHLSHHKNPTVPWIYLPNLGRAEDPQRSFLPWHYLKMWRGPRPATEHVQNKYAGKIIR